MTNVYSPAESTEINRLAQQAAYVWLLEIEVPTVPVSRYRLNNSAHALEWGTDGDGEPISYAPFPFQVSGLRRDAQGRQTTAVVTASNVTRELQAAIETYDGLIGQPARVVLVHKGLLATGEPLLELTGEIVTHEAGVEQIAFEIGTANLYAASFPNLRVSPLHCSHDYGGLLCGYDVNFSGALQTCSKRLTGTNGCEEHGEAEAAAGLEVRHPRRFGGFPGVPRNQGAGL